MTGRRCCSCRTTSTGIAGAPDFGRRLRLDGGSLGVGAITNLIETAGESALTLDQLPTMHQWEATSLRLESDERILASVNGEASTFESPLEVGIKRKRLRVLACEDRQADALRAFQDYCSFLADEVGTDPSPSVHKIEQRVASSAYSGRLD